MNSLRKCAVFVIALFLLSIEIHSQPSEENELKGTCLDNLFSCLKMPTHELRDDEVALLENDMLYLPQNEKQDEEEQPIRRPQKKKEGRVKNDAGPSSRNNEKQAANDLLYRKQHQEEEDRIRRKQHQEEEDRIRRKQQQEEKRIRKQRMQEQTAVPKESSVQNFSKSQESPNNINSSKTYPRSSKLGFHDIEKEIMLIRKIYYHNTDRPFNAKKDADLRILEMYLRNEVFLCQRIKHMYEKTSKKVSKIVNIIQIMDLLHVTYLTFWISIPFKFCSLCLNNSSCNFPYNMPCDSYFKSIISAFNSFKDEIKEIVGKIEDNEEFLQLSDIQKTHLRNIINEVLKLSTDLVSSDADLMEIGRRRSSKKPDVYEDGIIKYSLITDTVVNEKNYKTIFPSDAIMESIIKRKTEIVPITFRVAYQRLRKPIIKVIDETKVTEIEYFFQIGHVEVNFQLLDGKTEIKKQIHIGKSIFFNYSHEFWSELESRNLKIKKDYRFSTIELIEAVRQINFTHVQKSISEYNNLD